MRFLPLNRWFACIGVGIVVIPTLAGAAPRQNSPASRAPGSRSQAFPPLGTLIAQLKPLPGGPGLVVCEPVSIRTTLDLADFGAGCSRWLQFVVGGQGELGTTPLWPDLTRAQQELGRNDLRLGLEASKLKSILGVTHVVIGTIQGNPNHCLLTYQLYSLSPRVQMNASLAAEGSQAQVLARLPDLAKRLARDLGVKTPHVPPRVEGSAAEITTLGHLASLDGNVYTQAQT